MKIYGGNVSGRDKIDFFKKRGWGTMVTGTKYITPKEIDFAVDNGAFVSWKKGEEWDSNEFVKSIEKIVRLNLRPDFIVLPDIVAGGLDSLGLSSSWIVRVPSPKYLAVQDGMEMHLDKIDREFMNRIEGLFVGGTMKWKLKTGEFWVNVAKRMKIKCHIARVGTFKRLLWARRIGADSVDSTTYIQNWKTINGKSKLENYENMTCL